MSVFIKPVNSSILYHNILFKSYSVYMGGYYRKSSQLISVSGGCGQCPFLKADPEYAQKERIPGAIVTAVPPVFSAKMQTHKSPLTQSIRADFFFICRLAGCRAWAGEKRSQQIRFLCTAPFCLCRSGSLPFYYIKVISVLFDKTPVKISSFKGMDKRLGSGKIGSDGNIMNIAKP